MTDFSNRVKEFLAFHRSGVLATLQEDGYPGGALVPYDFDQSGNIYIFIAGLTQHARNLERDARSSLTVCDHFAPMNPQPYGRAVVYGQFLPLDEIEREEGQASYYERFPMSRDYPHDFSLLKCVPEAIYWNGGFASAGWVDMNRYRGVLLDQVVYHGMPMLEHMNEDHSSAVLELAVAYIGVSSKARYARLVGINGQGITVEYYLDEVRTRTRIPFPAFCDNPEAVRRLIIDMLSKARSEKTSD
jgi:putative heme iron utilization protein